MFLQWTTVLFCLTNFIFSRPSTCCGHFAFGSGLFIKRKYKIALLKSVVQLVGLESCGLNEVRQGKYCPGAVARYCCVHQTPCAPQLYLPVFVGWAGWTVRIYLPTVRFYECWWTPFIGRAHLKQPLMPHLLTVVSLHLCFSLHTYISGSLCSGLIHPTGRPSSLSNFLRNCLYNVVQNLMRCVSFLLSTCVISCSESPYAFSDSLTFK